ncbi:polysaccharide deacetylase family protein [Microbacterium sp.]|uniref:polysaccharide deacetylase family protein n=1 Tax=Microbacterium sp. TaxID=51671 RepID=UPI00333E3CB7
MKSLRVPLLAAGAVLLLLAGCAPEPQESAGPTPSAEPTLDPLPLSAFQTVPSADIHGLTTRSVDDETARIHAVVPQVDGHPELNATLAGFSDAQVADYRASGRVGGDGHGFISISWSTLGSSASLVGFLLSSEMSPGASTADTEKTVWYDTKQKRQLTLRDFVTPAGMEAVIRSVTQALRAHVLSPDVDGAEQILAGGEPAVGFDARGRLLVGFDSYQVAAGSYGAPLIAVDADPASLLTPIGQAARTATLDPKELEVPPPPPPAPNPPVDCHVQKCVALTFDDGPGKGTTPRLLDILKREKVHATFFVLGAQVQAHPQLVAREVKEGHEVGSHSWSHPQLTSLTPTAVREEVEKAGAAILNATGVKPVLFRPPYGARNAMVDGILKDAGYAEALWSVDTLDWKTRDAAKTVEAAAKAKPGAIVLMHDIHATTVDAVPGVIAALRAKGYVFVTVSELVGDPKPGARYFGTY